MHLKEPGHYDLYSLIYGDFSICLWNFLVYSNLSKLHMNSFEVICFEIYVTFFVVCQHLGIPATEVKVKVKRV